MSTQELIESLNSEALKTDLPRMDVGDTIRVHNRIVAGQKERVQVYEGVLISRKGRGINQMITVRLAVDYYGVERIWPYHPPMVDEIAKDYAGKIKVLKVNVDENQDLASRYGIMSIPTLLFLKDGEERDKIVGSVPKSKIEDKVKELI